MRLARPKFTISFSFLGTKPQKYNSQNSHVKWIFFIPFVSPDWNERANIIHKHHSVSNVQHYNLDILISIVTNYEYREIIAVAYYYKYVWLNSFIHFAFLRFGFI